MANEILPAATRDEFKAWASAQGWDVANAHSDGVTRWLNPQTRDLYLAWLEGRASMVDGAAK